MGTVGELKILQCLELCPSSVRAHRERGVGGGDGV